MKEKYQIAELTVQIEPRFEPLTPQLQGYRYLGNEGALYDLTVTEKILQSYRTRFPDASDPLIEYMASGAMFYYQLIKHHGLMLHSSAVVVDNEAYLFSAPSGTGKSTHTSHWLKRFSPNAYIINDDKPAIRIFDDGIYVYGTPWSGKNDLSRNVKVPLKGICFLERGPKNEIAPLKSIDAIQSLLSQTVRPSSAEYAELLLGLIDHLVTRVPIYRFLCTPSEDSVDVSYPTMSKGVVK